MPTIYGEYAYLDKFSSKTKKVSSEITYRDMTECATNTPLSL
jgi:hypothetical protein